MNNTKQEAELERLEGKRRDIETELFEVQHKISQIIKNG